MAKKEFTIFQWLVIFVALSAVGSQLLINSYYELNAPQAGQKALLEEKIKEFYASKSYLDRKAADSVQIAILSRDAEVRLRRNENSVEAGGRIVTNVKAQSGDIIRINQATQTWVIAELADIKAKYGEADPGSKWGGLGLIFIFEFLSVMLGFMTARIWANKTISPEGLRIVLTIVTGCLSIYAQTTSCQITERGLMLLLNDDKMAEAYSEAFIIIVPLYFWIGSFDLETKSRTVAIIPKAQIEMQEHTEEESLIHRRTIRNAKAQGELPSSLLLRNAEPVDYQEACQMKQMGTLQMSIREIADKFNVKKWQVEAALKVKRAISSPSGRSISKSDKTVA